MYLENFSGVKRFTILSIDEQYSLREQESGHVIVSPFDSLKDVSGAKRNTQGKIIPGQSVSLYCKWSGGKWCVFPLRPYQKRDSNTIDAIEDMHNEFKENGMGSLSQDVAAFGNSDSGGTIWWGVRDDGTVCGIEHLVERYGGQDKFSALIRNKIKQSLNTLIFLSIRLEFFEQSGHTVLRIVVPKSRDIVLAHGDSLYIRSYNTTQKLTGENLIAFFKMKLNATNN